MLLNHTTPQTSDFFWYDHRILKLGSLRDAYGINRIGIDLFFYSNYIFGLPPGNPLEDTLHMMEKTSLTHSFLQVNEVCPKRSIADVAGVVNDTHLDEPDIPWKGSTQYARLPPSTWS